MMEHTCKKGAPAVLVRLFLLAGVLLLSACETFHYGDQIRLRGAEVALLNWEQKDMPEKAREDAIRNTVLYRLDGKLYERATLAYAPITHVAAWHRWCCIFRSVGYNYSSEETVGEPTERREIMVQVHSTTEKGSPSYIPVEEFDFTRASKVTVPQVYGALENRLYVYAQWVPRLGKDYVLRDYMADLPARKVHPLNCIAGGIVHLAVDWPLNIIVNIINPLDVWHFPESWE